MALQRPNNADQSDVPALDQTLPEPLPEGPMGLFVRWFEEAHRAGPGGGPVQPNPNAMTLATVEADGRPSARVVLCKGIDEAGGSLVFHTHYRGRKGRALAANPRGAVVFHWDTLDRQVRIEGPVARCTAEESDRYFQTRPWLSRVGAWASEQSEPIGSREELREKLAQTMRRLGIDPENPPGAGAEVKIERPAHWGGFRLHAERVEMWVGGAGRLHDRAVWERELVPDNSVGGGAGYAAGGGWRSTRLQP